ncbi:hypothetical protein M422DRAFT_23690 [Sphaerobolus stellatus SS14]|nr:hypothetical protein M422DRAFT_23690 [Sphaerobolus stellatus SS14]
MPFIHLDFWIRVLGSIPLCVYYLRFGSAPKIPSNPWPQPSSPAHAHLIRYIHSPRFPSFFSVRISRFSFSFHPAESLLLNYPPVPFPSVPLPLWHSHPPPTNFLIAPFPFPCFISSSTFIPIPPSIPQSHPHESPSHPIMPF